MAIREGKYFYFGGKETLGLITISVGDWALHILPKRSNYSAYDKNGNLVEVSNGWLFGRFIEQYDCCATYYGAGPLFLFVGPP